MAFTALQSANGTLTITTVATVNFGDNTANIPIRYAYVIVSNLSGATAAPIYFTTNNTVPTVGGQDTLVVFPGQYVVAANALPWWSQAANVIAKANTPVISPGTPTETQPFGMSPYGQKASPGTIVQLISAQAMAYSVEGTG